MAAAFAKSPRQLPFDLARPAALTRDDLIVGPSNEQAVGLIERWPEWPVPVAVVVGPAGSGKSHLASIWCGISGACAIDRTELSPQAVAEASHNAVFVDNIDAARIDETGLFHLINTVHETRSGLLMTARCFPANWGVQLPDLASRLKAASVTAIGEPDDLLLAAVLTKLFADRQLEVEPHVIQYLVRRMERSLSSAALLVAQLDRVALERKSRITRVLASEVISAMGTPEQDG